MGDVSNLDDTPAVSLDGLASVYGRLDDDSRRDLAEFATRLLEQQEGDQP